MEAELAGLAGRLSMLADEEERLADSLRTQEVRLEQAEGSETLSRLRGMCVAEVKRLRGSVRMEDAVKYQNGDEAR